MKNTVQTTKNLLENSLLNVMKTPNKVLNEWFYKLAGGENRPVFFKVDEVNSNLSYLKENVGVIQAEIQKMLDQGAKIPQYHELDKSQADISAATVKKWKVFMLYAMGKSPTEAFEKAPETMALLDKIPFKFQAFFSILEPGKSIPAHEGPYLGYLRYHLCLRAPDKNAPYIRVKDQFYTWKTGEDVLFDDSWEHEVTNHCDETRMILVVDVLRPLPQLSHVMNQMFTWYARVFYAKFMLNLK